jgi:hypothetical protein
VIRETVSFEALAPYTLCEVRADLTGGHTPRAQAQHDLIDTGQPALPLRHDLGGERAVPIPRHVDGNLTGAASVGTVLARLPLRELPRFRPTGSRLS